MEIRGYKGHGVGPGNVGVRGEGSGDDDKAGHYLPGDLARCSWKQPTRPKF